jgi:protein-tyrosine phosphatase
MSYDHTKIHLNTDPTSRRMWGHATHGNTPFDVPFMSQINDNLWMGGCQDGLVLPKNIDHVVSLYPWERYKIKHDISTVLTIRMYDDADMPVDADAVLSTARWVNSRRKQGNVLVHCQAGLNRSGLVTAAALILGGMTASEAIHTLRARRSPAVLCNPLFVTWLYNLSDSRLGVGASS